MARLQRKYSSTGYYHIMLRGNERKNIFLNGEDRHKFMDIVHKKHSEAELLLFAYCLMDNHVHLVLKDNKNQISLIMKGIATSYAMYFNNKYRRTGHVFQDRFRSEAVEDERYLMAVIRYVHCNPIKAKLVEHPEQYKWSSYQWYMDPDGSDAHLVDTQYILGMIAQNRTFAISEFKRFFMEKNHDKFLDVDEDSIHTLEEGEIYLHNYLEKNWGGISKDRIISDKGIRTKVIAALRTDTDLPIVSISKLLGVNRGIVERVR
ncbi:MAG: transposase [Firmicutes bacterium]|nr:transposase [Bacillota bacterium]